jgi:excisionase family DNA binding protein
MIARSVSEAGGASKISAIDNGSEGAPTIARRLLSKRELAAVLNVSERTIDNWLAQKRIPRLRLSNRLTRFNLPKVEAALARYEVKEVGRR